MWQNIAGNFHIYRQLKKITYRFLVIQIQEAQKFFLAAMKKFMFQKRLKKMLSTRIKGKIMPTSNKLQKIMRVTTSQYETSSKNNVH